jgi:hypothetical protein
MSEDCAFDPNWWREPKALSLERKRRAKVPAALANPGDTFLVVTEGTVTEPVYFDLLLGDLQLTAVHVLVVPGDHSHPRHVIETARREADDQSRKAKKGLLGANEPATFDHVWAVVDTDVATRENVWNEIWQLAKARKVRLARSTPCFEYWLLLHFGFTMPSDLNDGEAAKSALKKAQGNDYSTNEAITRKAFGSLISKWPDAVGHAHSVRRHHEQAATPSPATPSTDVDFLVRALNDATPPHFKKSLPPLK